MWNWRPWRMLFRRNGETCAQEYGIPSQFGTHTAMLDKADLDAVYVIMAPPSFL